jgi:hypothetical protein
MTDERDRVVDARILGITALVYDVAWYGGIIRPRRNVHNGFSELVGLSFGGAVRISAARHSSLFSFRRPQCVSLREGLNVRSTFRFNALMTPIRANIVGPPNSATSIRASIAVCHSAASDSAFG